jgi:hypothetical protein
MRWIKLGTHIADHARLLAAGAVGRDLYVWGLTYSGKHETDGELPMVAVLTSAWGAGGQANIKVANTLVDVGLWARTDTGFTSLRWAEQGNETKTSLSEKREAAKARKFAKGSREPSANFSRTNTELLANEQRTITKGSTSMSLLDSGSDLGSGSYVCASARDDPPDWWDAALGTIEMNTGIALPSGEAWLRYSGHRDGKGLQVTRKDAMYWLTTVIVPELRNARAETARRDARDGERTAAFVRERHGPEVKPLPSVTPLMRERDQWEKTAATPAEQAASAAQLQKLLGGVGR